jgi:hypothetical protein
MKEVRFGDRRIGEGHRRWSRRGGVNHNGDGRPGLIRGQAGGALPSSSGVQGGKLATPTAPRYYSSPTPARIAIRQLRPAGHLRESGIVRFRYAGKSLLCSTPFMRSRGLLDDLGCNSNRLGRSDRPASLERVARRKPSSSTGWQPREISRRSMYSGSGADEIVLLNVRFNTRV